MIEYYETALYLPFLVKCHRRFDMEPTEGALATPAKAFHKKSLRLKGAGDPIDNEASKVAKLSAMGFMWNGLPSTNGGSFTCFTWDLDQS